MKLRLSPTRAATVVVGLAALVLYTATLARDVGPVDSGELTLAAWDLGVAHPPGFPLYLLLTNAVMSVPIGSMAARANFASALFAAIAAVALFRLTLLMLDDLRARTEWISIAGAISAAFIFMCLRTTWAYATVAEVYALSVCLTLLIWQLMLRPSAARMRAAALLFGLALGTHPAIVVSMLPAFALLVSRAHGVRFFVTREFVLLITLAAAGAGVYLYLPLAASSSPALNWGDPRTPERFWAHVSGLQYRGEAFAITLPGFLAGLRRTGAILATQSGPFGLALLLFFAAAGALHTFRRHGALFGTLAAWMAVNLLLTTTMSAGWAGDRSLESIDGGDLDAYYLPLLVVASALAGIGVAALLHLTPSRRRLAWYRAAIGGFAAAAVLLTLASNWRANDRRRDVLSRMYAGDVLQSIAVNGMVLTRDWNLSSPLMYVQDVAGVRTDVVAVDLNLIERRWYAESLARRQPRLFAAAQPELSSFLDLGGRWEQDPRSIQRDAAYLAALNDRLEALLLKMVDVHLGSAPVYVTFDVMVGQGGTQDRLASRLASRFQLVPQGLVFQLTPDPGFHDPAPLELSFSPDVVRGAGPHHALAQRMARVYRDMLISRGLYLETHGQCSRALPAFGLALAIDSTSPTADAVKARCR